MTLETFFEKFDQFADAPDAVAKMREVVLNFAVTGRLSERRAGDGPVSDLIGSLSTAKERRLNKRRRTTEVVGAALVEIDRPVVVPDHWAWIPLNEIGALSGGMTPSKAKSVFWDGDVNWFSSKDIKPDELTESELKITREGMESTGLQLYPPGCLVMVARSGILKHTFPVSILRVEGTVNQDLKVFSPFVGGLERYLQIMLRGLNGFIITSLVKTGMTVQSLKYEEFALQPFPLPPLAEQKRIVAKVDELMALCDRLALQQQERETRHAALARASLARFADAPTPANLPFLFHPSYAIPPADLRKAILTLAFAGKLVSQDPSDEPASVLLEKARAEKARLIEAGLVKKEPWADKLQDATTFYDLPPGWEWTHVSDVVEKVTVGFVGSMKEEYREGGVPFLRCQNVRVNRYEPIGLTFVSKEFHRSISKSTLRPGDVVVTRSGNVGVTCVIPESLPEANCSDLVIVKRPLALVPAFLSYFVNSIASGQIEAKTVGIALTHFNTQSVAQMTVALPPLAEQRRIVAKVDQLMALVDALEQQLAASRATTANLLSALVAELTATS